MLAATRHADASVVDADVGDDIHGWDAYPLGVGRAVVAPK
jgi:hypothetical protein